jgi:transposase-like protein
MNTIKPRRERKIYSAAEKGMAVLAVWSGRRVPGRISRQMGISWTVISNWEKRALEGMLRGLGVETGNSQPENGELGKRLERLLAQELTPETESKERAAAEK